MQVGLAISVFDKRHSRTLNPPVKTHPTLICSRKCLYFFCLDDLVRQRLQTSILSVWLVVWLGQQRAMAGQHGPSDQSAAKRLFCCPTCVRTCAAYRTPETTAATRDSLQSCSSLPALSAVEEFGTTALITLTRLVQVTCKQVYACNQPFELI